MGAEETVHFSAPPMKNSKGEIYGIVCLVINISGRKKMEMARRRLICRAAHCPG